MFQYKCKFTGMHSQQNVKKKKINCLCSYAFVKKDWLKLLYLLEITLTVSPDLNKNAFCQE